MNTAINIYAKNSIEEDFSSLKNILSSTPEFSRIIIEVDKLFDIDTSFAEKRLNNMINNYKKSDSFRDFDKMLNIVQYLEKFYSETSRNFREQINPFLAPENVKDNILPYSVMVSRGLFSCVSLTFDFITLTSYENLEAFFVYLPNHVTAITFLDDEEWIIEISSDKRYTNYARALKKRGQILNRPNYYRAYNKDPKSFYNDRHGKPVTKHGALVEYLIRLSFNFDHGSKNETRDLRAAQLALKIFPDYDKARYYLGVRYYYRENLHMVKTITSEITWPHFRKLSNDMIYKLERYLSHKQK